MITRPIPSSGEAMPVVGLGTWQVFDVGPGYPRRARNSPPCCGQTDAGGRMIDTSPMYGRAEAEPAISSPNWVYARAFFLRRKSGPADASRASRRCGVCQLLAARSRLVQIHNLLDWRTHLATLRRMKEDGRVRYIGITHYTTGSLPELARILEPSPASISCSAAIRSKPATPKPDCCRSRPSAGSP